MLQQVAAFQTCVVTTQTLQLVIAAVLLVLLRQLQRCIESQLQSWPALNMQLSPKAVATL